MDSSPGWLMTGTKRQGEKAHKKCEDCRRKKIKVSDRQSFNPVVLSIEPSLNLRVNSAFLQSETGLSSRSVSHVNEVGSIVGLTVVSMMAR